MCVLYYILHKESFLVIAEELELKELMGERDEKSHGLGPSAFPKQIKREEALQKQPTGFKSVHTDQKLATVRFEQGAALQKYVSEDLQLLDEQVKSMMEKKPKHDSRGQNLQGMWKKRKCDYHYRSH